MTLTIPKRFSGSGLWGGVGARTSLLAWMLAFSLGVHLLLTPLAGWLGLLTSWLVPPTADPAPAKPISAISIDWIGELEPAAGPPESTATPGSPQGNEPEGATLSSPPPDAESEEGEPRRPSPKPEPKPEKTKKANEVESPPKPKPKERTKEAPKAPSREIEHPVAQSDKPSSLIPEDANVNLLLRTHLIRQHSLGPAVGELLRHFPQWSSFLASTHVDPIRDFDQVLVVGPQLRRTDNVVAVIEHHQTRAAMREAVDALVSRSRDGRWLEAPFPMALAHADRAERLFALTAEPIVVVAPPSLKAQLLEHPIQTLGGASGDAAVLAHVKTPWRALIGLPVGLPRSFEWARLALTLQPSGDARLTISALDADPASARRHASELQLAINALTNPDLGALGSLLGIRSLRFIDPIELTANGKRITGSVSVRHAQLQRLLALAQEWVAGWSRARQGRATKPLPPLPPRAKSAQPGASPRHAAPTGAAERSQQPAKRQGPAPQPARSPR